MPRIDQAQKDQLRQALDNNDDNALVQACRTINEQAQGASSGQQQGQQSQGGQQRDQRK